MLPTELLISRQVLETYSRARISHQIHDTNLASATILGNYTFYYNQKDKSIADGLGLNGYWESWVTVAMARLLKPGWHCLDVGANLGYFSVLMADAVGKSGRVLAIEPYLPLHSYLKRTIESNNFDQLELINKAVSSISGEKLDFFTSELSMNSSIHQRVMDREILSVSTVETITLDDIAQRVGQIDFIKIDIEGAEEDAWYGMQSLIQDDPQVKIFLEFDVARYLDSPKLLQDFQTKGFTIRNINEAGEYNNITTETILSSKAGHDWFMLFLEKESPINISSSKTKSLIRPNGINFIGDATLDIGLAEITRRILDAIIASDILVSYQEYVNPWFNRQEIEHDLHPYHAIKRGNIYDVNLIFYNILEFNTLTSEQLKALTGDKYTIVYWLWEQPLIPESITEAFYYVDEIWTASEYCKLAFSAVRPIPVHVIPHPIQIAETQPLSHTQLGIPEDRFTFLFSFAVTSSDFRKNPLGVIEAFRRAFPQNSPQSPMLIIKAHHLDISPEYTPILRDQLATINGVLIEESLSRQAMNNLLASVDCYISLHRAEGFGIGMAEAMALGIPVIATNYSGNLDFMNDENSFLVRHKLRQIVETDFKHQPTFTDIYEVGQIWAEPDLDHAAELMQFVIANPEVAIKRGQIAKANIETHFSPEVVATKIKQRLVDINPAVRQSVWKHIPPLAEQDIIDQQKSHEELHALLETGEANFEEWEYRRIPETRQAIYKLPLVGYILRTLVRVKNLGKMWANLKYIIESMQLFNKTLLKKVDDLPDHQHLLDKLVADMRLHNQQHAQDKQQIEQLKTEIDDLKRQVEEMKLGDQQK
jgi:FkbM family methyltransferase